VDFTQCPDQWVDFLRILLGPVPDSGHKFKYRLAFVVDQCGVVRFDNETGKGDHKHIGDKEAA
jgi:Family of unknown function (DUF6516)